IEGLVDSRVEAEVCRVPRIIAHADDREVGLSPVHDRLAKVAYHGKTATVPCVAAHIDSLAQAVASKHVHRMALVKITPEMRVGSLVHEARVSERIGNPAAQPVGAAPLESELESARVAAQRVGEDGAESRVQNRPLRIGGAELAFGGEDSVRNLAVIRLNA